MINTSTWVQGYLGQAFQESTGASTEAVKLEEEAMYQLCNDTTCLPVGIPSRMEEKTLSMCSVVG